MDTTFAVESLPDNLRTLAQIISARIEHDQGRAPSGCGCKAFYTREEWAARGERLVPSGALVMVHDGGDLSTYFGSDPWVGGRDAMIALIEAAGFRYESGACWYSVAIPVRMVPTKPGWYWARGGEYLPHGQDTAVEVYSHPEATGLRWRASGIDAAVRDNGQWLGPIPPRET